MLMKKLNVIIEVPEDQIALRKASGFVPYDLAAAKRRKLLMQERALSEGAIDVVAFEKIEVPEDLEETVKPAKKTGKKEK